MILPYDLEVEKAVLGCFILDEVTISNIHKINDSYFYTKETKLIFNSMQELTKEDKVIDIITLSEKLKTSFGNEVYEYITNLTRHCNYMNFKTYLNDLTDFYERRQYILAAEKIKNESINQIFMSRKERKNSVLKHLDINIDEKAEDDFRIVNAALNATSQIEALQSKIVESDRKYYYPKIDNMKAGLHNTEVTVIAARPGRGKTSFAVQLSINLSKHKKRGIVFTREMAKEAITTRIISNVSNIDGNKMRFKNSLSENEFTKIVETSSYIRSTSKLKTTCSWC